MKANIYNYSTQAWETINTLTDKVLEGNPESKVLITPTGVKYELRLLDNAYRNC